MFEENGIYRFYRRNLPILDDFREEKWKKVGIENRERNGIAISESGHETGSTGIENGVPTGLKRDL